MGESQALSRQKRCLGQSNGAKMSILSRTMLLIIDRLRKSPERTALLNDAIGGDADVYSQNADNGLTIFHLIKLGFIDVIDDSGQSRAHEIPTEVPPKGYQPNSSFGYDIFVKFIRTNGTLWRARLTDHFFYLQNKLNFSIRELLSKYNFEYRFISCPIFSEPKSDLVADVFVLMPFAETFKPVFDDHIKTVCNKLGYTVQRADDIFRAGNIIDDVWSMIYNAKKVIVDCTSRNPNVFYELGISDTIGKDVVIITQNKDDIPFDLRHRRYIKYVFTPRGMK